MASPRKKTPPPRVFIIKECIILRDAYNKIQLRSLARMEFVVHTNIIGMLSTAKDQILRIAANMHILFHLEKEEEVSEEIIEDAVQTTGVHPGIPMPNTWLEN